MCILSQIVQDFARKPKGGRQRCQGREESRLLQTSFFLWGSSRAATMLRESGNILDIVSAVCSRSNRALGFVNQHRVHSLMKALCRTANSCKAGLIVGALRVACNGLCTAARFHTAEENPGFLLGCHEGLDCLRHYNRCPTLFESFRSLWPRHQRVYLTNGYLR